MKNKYYPKGIRLSDMYKVTVEGREIYFPTLSEAKEYVLFTSEKFSILCPTSGIYNN